MGTAVFLKEFGKIRPVGHFPGLGQTLNFLLCSYTVGWWGEGNPLLKNLCYYSSFKVFLSKRSWERNEGGNDYPYYTWENARWTEKNIVQWMQMTVVAVCDAASQWQYCSILLCNVKILLYHLLHCLCVSLLCGLLPFLIHAVFLIMIM